MERSSAAWRKGSVVLAVAVLGLGTAAAHAEFIGFTVEFSGTDHDAPHVRLTNDSASASITALVLTIGDLAYNFDSAVMQGHSPGVSYALATPDADPQGGARSDWDEYTFSGFGPGLSFDFISDVDIDSAETLEDYRHVLFDLDAKSPADNAMVSVTFSTGLGLSAHLPDFHPNPNDTYVLDLFIPEPAVCSLLIGGALALLARRHRSGAAR